MEHTAKQPAVASNGLALAALIVGIVAFCFGWIVVLGAVLGITALILGLVALKKKQNKAMSIVAVVLGAIATLTSILVTLAAIAFFTNPDVQRQFQDSYNQSQSSQETNIE